MEKFTRLVALFVAVLLGMSQNSTATEQDVSQRFLQTNYRNCLTLGIGGYGCQAALLSTEQKDAVNKAALGRNYRNCLTLGIGGYGCQVSLLSESELKEVSDNSKQTNLFPPTGSLEGLTPLPPAGYPCAENGSCYGDISDLTGRPKTVPVKGYFRKDGTYVRGHYRSKPRN
jgi:hypothetical protein